MSAWICIAHNRYEKLIAKKTNNTETNSFNVLSNYTYNVFT